MRRIAIAVMSTITGLVLLFSYHTSLGPEGGASAQQDEDGDLGSLRVETDGDGAATQDAQPSDQPSAEPTEPAAASPTSAKPSPGTSPRAVSGTFTGARVQTKWGPVRVRIVVRNSKIVKATAIEFPNENDHDRAINDTAVPQLQDATVRANSARIDAISGATVTSRGYVASLQSALDQAHL